MSDNLVKQASYILKEEGVAETASKLRRLGEANERTAVQTEILTRQQALQEQTVTRLGSKLETFARKYDPIYKAQKEAERAEGLVAAAQKRGVEVTDAASRALEIARARHRQLAEAAQQSKGSIGGAGDSVALFNERIGKIEEFAWNNTGFSANEIERVTLPLKTMASTIGVLPTVGVAAFAAVAAAVGALAVRAYNTSVAAQQLADNLSLSGQVNAFQGQSASAQQLAEQMTHISSAWDLIGRGAALPTEEVKKFGAELAKLPGATGEMASSFVELARQERYAFGSEGVDMVQGLVAALRQPEQALQTLISENLGLSAAQRQAAQSALDSGNSQRQASTYFQLVTDDFIRQKAEVILLDAANNSLSGSTRQLASEALAAAQMSGDFAAALETLAGSGNTAAGSLLKVVGSIRNIRSELGRGLSGVELSNQLQNAIDKLDPSTAKIRAANAAFADAKSQIAASNEETERLNRGMTTLRASGELSATKEAEINARLTEQAGIREKLGKIAGLQSVEARKALEEQQGGSTFDRTRANIDRAHEADHDEVAKAREKIAQYEYQLTQMDKSEVAKRLEIEKSLADERKGLAKAQLDVQIARIDAEIAQEAAGTTRKKELARKKFELETQGVAKNSAFYIEKESALQTTVDEEPKKGKGERKAKPASTDKVETYIRSLDKENTTLQAEADAQGKSNVEKEKALDLARAQAAARERGTPLTQAEIEQVARLAETHAKLRQQIDDAAKAQAAAREQAQFFGNTAFDAVDKLLEPGAKFNDVLKSIIKTLEQALLKAALLGEGPLASLFGTKGKNGDLGGLFGAIGGLFNGGAAPSGQTAGASGAVSASGGGFFSSLLSGFSGPYAEGGTIPAGGWGVVGERGPEPIFAGAMPVSIMPNALARSVLGGAPGARGAGASTTTHNNINFNVTTPDAGSFVRSEGQMTALLSQAIARGQRNL